MRKSLNLVIFLASLATLELTLQWLFSIKINPVIYILDASTVFVSIFFGIWFWFGVKIYEDYDKRLYQTRVFKIELKETVVRDIITLYTSYLNNKRNATELQKIRAKNSREFFKNLLD